MTTEDKAILKELGFTENFFKDGGIVDYSHVDFYKDFRFKLQDYKLTEIIKYLYDKGYNDGQQNIRNKFHELMR